MSQKVSSEILYGEGAPSKKIALVNSSVNERISPSSGQYNRIGDYSVLLAADWTNAAGNWNVLIGGSNGGHLGPSSPKPNLQGCVAIGYNAVNDYNGSVSLGSFSQTSSVGEVNIGSSNTSYGYNSSNYRLLSGLYDPQTAHDAATKGYVDAHAGGASVANLYINMNDLPTTVGSQTADNNIYSDPELTQALTGLNVRNSLANNDLTIINIIDKVNGVYPIKTYATTSSIASAEDIEAYSGMDFWIPASSIDGSLVNHGFYVYFEGPESGIFQFSLV